MAQGALRFRGIDPFTEQSLRVLGRRWRITYEPVASAETADGGWIVPGLVDAHNHVGIAPPDVTIEQARHRRTPTRRPGPADPRRSARRWTRIRSMTIRCVRVHPVGAPHRPAQTVYARGTASIWSIRPTCLPRWRQAADGDGWVKIVGDWIDRG